MEKLGYEVKVGVHISVKAEGMRRSRRLDMLDEFMRLESVVAKMNAVREILSRLEYLGHTVLRKTIGTNFKTDERRFATDECAPCV